MRRASIIYRSATPNLMLESTSLTWRRTRGTRTSAARVLAEQTSSACAERSCHTIRPCPCATAQAREANQLAAEADRLADLARQLREKARQAQEAAKRLPGDVKAGSATHLRLSMLSPHRIGSYCFMTHLVQLTYRFPH